MLRRTFVASVTATGFSLAAPTLTMARKGPIQPSEDIDMAQSAPQTGYVPVNGLEMYYEIHGSGQPLVLLHGVTWLPAYPTITAILAVFGTFAGRAKVTTRRAEAARRRTRL